MDGVQLNFDTLGIINGIIDEAIQAPYYPEFARYNTYGIESVKFHYSQQQERTILTGYHRSTRPSTTT